MARGEYKGQTKVEYNLEWRKNNRERARERSLRYYHKVVKNDPDMLAKKRAASNRSYHRNRLKRLTYNYGIEPEEYLAMVEQQDGKCLICGKAPDVLAVDHDHQTGEVRGLLCKPCNAALGAFNDDYMLLQKAAAYLWERGLSKRAN